MEATSQTGVARWLGIVHHWLVEPLFQGAPEWLNAATILKLIFYLVALVWISAWIRRLLIRRVFPRMRMEPGQGEALATIARYLIMVLGLFVALQTTGVDLSSVTVLFGALGVGVGFSLQAVASNVFSGLVILLERPIQVGDRVQIGELNGQVHRIRLRATEVLTNDNIMVIVPNTDLIVHQVVNWSRGGDTVRVHVPVGVASGSDVDLVRRTLLEAAAAVPQVLRNPEPTVRLRGFGDSSLDFELLCWTREFLHRPRELASRVNLAVHEAVCRAGISLPFPQRDLHLRTPAILRVEVGGRDAGPALPRATTSSPSG